MKDYAEPILILVGLVSIMILSTMGPDNQSSGSRAGTNSGGFLENSDESGQAITSSNSPYENSVSVSYGNAAYAIQSYEEYITLTNYGKESLNITDWQIKNGKDKRTYYLNGSLQRFVSDIATIPQGTLFISPDSNNRMQDIILETGESAILTTGRLGSQFPYKIVSFKENKCSGYLENMPEYDFSPSLSSNCPLPRNTFGLEVMDTECRRFVERLPSCQTPEFGGKDKNDNPCPNCVNGTQLSSTCTTFTKINVSYAGCVASHLNDPDFSGHTWRVFLGHGWEMWAEQYETIEIFDNIGRLVHSSSY